jgi:GTPase SAR1 family protein
LTNNKKAFAIGILGEYGSGKTSFMNLIIKSLDKQTTAVLYFNPWSSEQVNHIQQDFFDLLVAKLADIDPDISSLIHKYSRRLSRVDERTRSWVSRFVFLNSFHAGTKAVHKRIDDKLQAIDKKIIISIDDIDRLYKEEVIEVLRLIRNTANFSNICYLVTYDKSYVQDAIKELSEKGNHNYLDKIFQIEIPLPKTEQGDLVILLKEKLIGVISESHLALFEAKIERPGLHRDYDKTYVNIFRNSRDVVRFINGFKLIYNLIGKEVYFVDLFVLELIKFRFPVVYNAIYEKRDQFLNTEALLGAYKEYFTPRVNDLQSTFHVYLKKQFIDDDIVVLNNNLFNYLFNNDLYKSPQATNAISYPQHFDVYFRYRLANTDLSERMYMQAVRSDQLTAFIDDCISKNLHDAILIRLLREGQISTRIHFEKIIKALFYLGPKYILEKPKTSFPYDDLARMMIDYDGERVKKLYGKDKESYSSFISDLFENAKPNYLFENGFIKVLKEKYADLILDSVVLTDYQIAYLQRLVNAKQALSDDGTWLIWGIKKPFTGEELAGKNRYWPIHPEVYPLLKQAFKNEDPKCFLKSTIVTSVHDDHFCLEKIILELFSSPDELRVWVYKNDYLDKDIKAEYLRFFDSGKNALFTATVEFNFNTELKSD